MKIWAKTEEFSEGKYLVVRRDGTVPEWPHFVLGGFDPCAAYALKAYAGKARSLGYDPAFVESIYELADDFQDLSDSERARKIADPDAGPHRRDNPALVDLMGWRADTVTVTLRREHAGQRPDEAPAPSDPQRAGEGVATYIDTRPPVREIGFAEYRRLDLAKTWTLDNDPSGLGLTPVRYFTREPARPLAAQPPQAERG